MNTLNVYFVAREHPYFMTNPNLSVTEASKRFNIDRSRIYRAFKSGEMSRNPDGTVQLVEILRVFGNVQKTFANTSSEHVERSGEHVETLENHPLYKAQQEKIRLLEDSLREAKEREQWQRGQMEKLTDTIKLLEAPKTPNTPRRVWWKFWEN
jgi:hypothetical protein